MKTRILPPLISVRELAPVLGVHPATLRRWCRADGFPAPFGNGRLRWLRRDLYEAGILPATHLVTNPKPSLN
jgi:hypothetical protein